MKRPFAQLALSIAVIVLGLAVTEQLDLKVDLTEDQRHSFTPTTEALFKQLGQDGTPVLVRCYLTGDFPAAYRRLADEIRGVLRSFHRMSSGHLKFEFIDISASGDAQTAGQIELKLYEQGLRFSRISYRNGTTTAQQNVWACAMLTVNGADHPIQFLRSETMQPNEITVQNAINQLEFTLASTLRRALRSEKPSVGFLRSHNTFLPVQLADFTLSLEEYAEVVDVKLDGSVNALCTQIEGMKGRLPRFDALVVAGPDSTFSEKDKLLLDQFLMHGGRILWLVDPIRTDLDSLREKQNTVGITREIGLFDQLFHYGVRMNRDLILDAQCAPIMLDAGPGSGGRNYQMFNWYFSPLAIGDHKAHPIASNLDPIHFNFVSSLDTVNANPAIAKSVLLKSSARSVRYKAPVRISSAVVNLPPEHFEEGPGGFPMAVLLEGQFSSFFENRLLDTLRHDPSFGYRPQSKPTAMIAISDADIARNKVRPDGDQLVPLPLGYDPNAQRVVYDNKEFLLNAMSYLLDDRAAISIRSRSIELRPLERSKTAGASKRWSGLALGLPLLIVLTGCGAVRFVHHRKFSRLA